MIAIVKPLLDFLRLSRSSIDDTITNNLNALLTPSQSGFDPASTSRRNLRSGNTIFAPACEEFRNQVLFPTWKSRDDVIAYCEQVAATPDVTYTEFQENRVVGYLNNNTNQLDDRLTKVDNRSDPYANRTFEKYGRAERLRDLLGNEKGVERIVRSRTWNIVQNRCQGADEGEWQDAFGKWRRIS